MLESARFKDACEKGGAAQGWRQVRGWGGIAWYSDSGKRALVDVVMPGDEFCPDTLTLGGHLSYEALSKDCKVVPLVGGGNANGLDAAENGRLSLMIYRLLALQTHSARERLLRFLAEIQRRQRTLGTSEDDSIIQLPLTQSDLGALIGATSVHVSRTARSLREAGIVDLQAGVAVVLDQAQLDAAVQEFELDRIIHAALAQPVTAPDPSRSANGHDRDPARDPRRTHGFRRADHRPTATLDPTG